MAKNKDRNRERSELGEQSGMSGSERTGDQSIDRSHIDALEMDRSQTGRQQGRESTDNSGRSFSGQGGQKEASSEEAEGTGYSSDDVESDR